ncbi:GNAT family N-acetyltransferase [Lysobacteraceae bacterium NML75-0749]|nr:GNAT family N-acetyltransferase [Xanthomonadaceae bacterium NML75-0749]PJK04205.1 GNAT family N-acetyltransferase [Xanthomonadaceae bacterium NML91-0268]
MSLQIRRASSADAEVLAALSCTTFSETFGHLYAAADLAEFLASTYTAEKYRDALDEAGCAAWIAEDAQGQAQGYALAGPCGLPHEAVLSGDMELKRLYVLASHQGTGWGQQLFAEAERWMWRNGPEAIWLGVWSQNHRAQRFYQRQGFERVGQYLFPVGQARDLEYILRKAHPLG